MHYESNWDQPRVWDITKRYVWRAGSCQIDLYQPVGDWDFFSLKDVWDLAQTVLQTCAGSGRLERPWSLGGWGLLGDQHWKVKIWEPLGPQGLEKSPGYEPLVVPYTPEESETGNITVSK